MELILILIIIILGVVCYFSIKGNIASKKKLKRYEDLIDQLTDINNKTVTVENIKTKIREKYNVQENNINNTDGVTDVMPNRPRQHNHTFRSPCGKDCPAYSGT
jgi:hypothetical protein